MPMDGVMLGFIARELNQKLAGGRVDKIAQPEKDELLLLVRSLGENCQLLITSNPNSARAHLTRIKKNNPMEPPTFCMLMRKHLSGARVRGVRQAGGDRILEIAFDVVEEMGDAGTRTLICEFMGRHSNLIFTSGERIVDSAKHVTEDVSRVREVLPGLRYERPPQEKLPYDALEPASLEAALREASGSLVKALCAGVSGLSAGTAREIALRTAGDEDARLEDCELSALSQRVCALLAAFPEMADPRVAFDGQGNPVDVTPFAYRTRSGLENRAYASVSEALEAYFGARDKIERMKQKSASLHRVLKTNVERCEKKLALQLAALQDGERMEEYRVKGELLTAGLSQAKKGQGSVELVNYYDPDCASMTVELDVKLSPAQNAQRYFKLYQKARSAKTLALEQKQKTEEELTYLEGQLENLGKCTEEGELFEIRDELERLGYVRANHNRRERKSLPPSSPLKFAAKDGTVVLVGKNNVQNDKLTFSAEPMEYWLHVKDMPGSHVIVASENPSEDTLLAAASLAAHYSKGKTSPRVPVDVTRRKYVKKPSGAKPGFVIYTHQKTLYVEPRDAI